MFSRALIANTFLVSKLFLQFNFRMFSSTETKKLQTEINRYVGGKIHRFNPQTKWLCLPKKEGGLGLANCQALSAACWEHWKARAPKLVEEATIKLKRCKTRAPLLKKLNCAKHGPTPKLGPAPLKHLYENNLYENISNTSYKHKTKRRKGKSTVGEVSNAQNAETTPNASSMESPKPSKLHLSQEDLSNAKALKIACQRARAKPKTHEVMLRWAINKLPVKLIDFRRDNCVFCDAPKPSNSHIILTCNQLAPFSTPISNELAPTPLPIDPFVAATALNSRQFDFWSQRVFNIWRLYCKKAYSDPNTSHCGKATYGASSTSISSPSPKPSRAADRNKKPYT
jgi:hypothetical protein